MVEDGLKSADAKVKKSPVLVISNPAPDIFPCSKCAGGKITWRWCPNRIPARSLGVGGRIGIPGCCLDGSDRFGLQAETSSGLVCGIGSGGYPVLDHLPSAQHLGDAGKLEWSISNRTPVQVGSCIRGLRLASAIGLMVG